jgi:hypothetical protein
VPFVELVEMGRLVIGLMPFPQTPLVDEDVLIRWLERWFEVVEKWQWKRRNPMWFGEREGRTRGAGMIEKTYFCVCSCALNALVLVFILTVF